MAKAHAFETITDSTKGADLIHKYIRQQRVEYPDDLADLISEIAAELLCSVDACHRADFLMREQNNKKEAERAMTEVMTAISAFKNQFGFLVSQADYCLHGVSGTRLSNENYSHNPNNRIPILPVKMIADGLNSVKSDFKGWCIERRTGGWVLAVETHPIRIEDPRYDVVVDFGAFNIELQLSQLARGVRKPYHIVALQPNIVEGNAAVSHPHVRSQILCEGNGEVMITKALKVGDIQSFLIIVSQILGTYNPDSPYLRLEYWSKKLPRGPNPRPHATFGSDESNGEICAICEEELGDSHECSLCSAVICEDCSRYCDLRDRTICERCLTTLRDERRACGSCTSLGNAGCLVEERQPCADCSDLFRPTEMIRCGAQSRYMCSSCFDSRATGHRPCCANWESTAACPLHASLSRVTTGFAASNAPYVNTEPIREAQQTPRRGEGFIDTAPDDGVGGFAPPVDRNPVNGHS